MKKLNITFVFVILFGLLPSGKIKAQFLKQIMNSVKQTTQNRANNKADQVTNKVLDKVDNATQTKSANGTNTPNGTNTANSSSQDSLSSDPAMNKVLGAFANAAANNPNDTSASDLTMKALGNLVGGGGVSAADSAAAIKSFTTANGGAGFYYETTNTVVTEKGTTKSVNKTWFTTSGEGRVEMNLAAMMGVGGARPMIGISRVSKPNYSMILDDEDKTYSLNVVDTSLINSGSKYIVTKIGNEIVGGYPCIHSKLTSSGRNEMDMDIWTCKSVAGYSLLEKMMASSKSMVTPEMFNALKQAGADGYFVKIEIKNKSISSEMLLTKVEQKNLPASLFAIPAGYTESKYNGVIGNMMKASQSQK
jgi:Domain of unknown function (DUF4412)